MRNSISVILVVIAIIAAFGSTFVNGVAEANAAGLVASTGSAYGLVIALLIGLLGVALKPSNGPSKDQAIEAAFLLAAREEHEEAIAAWPVWEGVVLPECLTPESAVRLVSDGIELCDEMMAVRSTAIATVTVTAKQAKAIAQQRAIKSELNRKDLSSAELFSLGLALVQAKKGLLA